MFDFPIQEFNLWAGLYCFFFYTIFILCNKKALLHPYSVSISPLKKRAAVFLAGLFIVTHCLNGDFYHLMWRIQEWSFIPGERIGNEEIYYNIAKITNQNYFIFRVIVWGGAFSAFCWTAHRMNLPIYYAAIYLVFTHAITFSYARVSLAMACYFLGLSFLCRPTKRKWISYVIGVSLIIASVLFHKSALIMIAITIIILIPINKWTVFLIIISISFLSAIAKTYLGIIAEDIETDAYIAKKITNYSDREVINGTSGIILKIFEYASFYIPFFFCSRYILFDKKQIRKDIYLYYKVSFGIMIISAIFLFMGSTYITFFYRILFMTMLPLTIINCRLYQDGILSHRYLIYCVIPGVLYHLMRYAYAIYLVHL